MFPFWSTDPFLSLQVDNDMYKLFRVLPRNSAIMNRMVVRSLSVRALVDEDSVKEFCELNSKTILYFTANWCGRKFWGRCSTGQLVLCSILCSYLTFLFVVSACKQIKPIYEDLSKKYQGVAFGRIDVDENADAAVDFEISSVSESTIEKSIGRMDEHLKQSDQFCRSQHLFHSMAMKQCIDSRGLIPYAWK